MATIAEWLASLGMSEYAQSFADNRIDDVSAKLDPEDLRAIIGSYHHCCTEVITRSGGFVAQYMGDGVQVLGVGSTEGRFEALRTATTPLVGRAEEIELLLRRWNRRSAATGKWC